MKTPEKIEFILIIICAVIFILTGISVLSYLIKNHSEKLITQDIKEYINEDEETYNTSVSASNLPKRVITLVNIDGVYVWDKYVEVYLANKDFVSWIDIPDTSIDYPVMLTKDDNEYYIDKDFYHSPSDSGTLFADNRSDMNSLANNVVIYGHNMKTGTMFGTLEKWEDKTYFNDHKTVYLDTLNGPNEYKVVAAIRTTTDDFDYYNYYKNSDDYQKAKDFIKNAKEKSAVFTDFDENDKFLTLSTCAYQADNGRFVLLCKQTKSFSAYEKEYITYKEYLKNRTN